MSITVPCTAVPDLLFVSFFLSCCIAEILITSRYTSVNPNHYCQSDLFVYDLLYQYINIHCSAKVNKEPPHRPFVFNTTPHTFCILCPHQTQTLCSLNVIIRPEVLRERANYCKKIHVRCPYRGAIFG